MLAYCQGASESLPHPSPGREVNAFACGIAVQTLLQATPLHVVIESWPLPRLGILVYSMLCHIVALIPGAGVRCPFLSSQASWRRLRTPLPLLLGLRASLYRPKQTRDSRNGRLLYPVRAVRCSLDRFAAHRQRCELFLFAAG